MKLSICILSLQDSRWDEPKEKEEAKYWGMFDGAKYEEKTTAK